MNVYASSNKNNDFSRLKNCSSKAKTKINKKIKKLAPKAREPKEGDYKEMNTSSCKRINFIKYRGQPYFQ